MNYSAFLTQNYAENERDLWRNYTILSIDHVTLD